MNVGPLAEPPLQLGPHVLDRDLGDVPLREHDQRRALRLPRHVGRGEVAFDDALARVDQDEADVGALRRLERAQLRVVLDPLPLTALAAQTGGVDELKVRSPRSMHRVDRVARRARHLRHDRALLADERVEERRLADVRPAEDRDADRLVAVTVRVDSPGSSATISSSRSPVFVPCSAESGNGSPRPRRWNSSASESCGGVVDLVREHEHRLLRLAQDLRRAPRRPASRRRARRRRRARGRPRGSPCAPARRSTA